MYGAIKNHLQQELEEIKAELKIENKAFKV